MSRVFLPLRLVILSFVALSALPSASALAQSGGSYVFGPSALVNDEGAGGILSSTESSGQRALASRQDTVYAAWADERVSPARVYLARSEDRGATWKPNVAVTDSAAAGAFPGLAVSPAGGVYVAWQDFRASPLAKVHLARSLDGGRTFGPSVWVSAPQGPFGWDGHPAVACAGTVGAAGADTVYIAWLRHEDFARRIYLARSLDGGLTFGAPVAVENRCDHVGDPVAAAAPGGRVVVAWEDDCDYYGPCGMDSSFCGYRIYRAKSTDGGQSFNPPRPATPLLGPSRNPALALDSAGDILLVWSGIATEDALTDIYFARNPVGGLDYASADLVQVDGMPPGTVEQDQPSVALDSLENPRVAWRDARLGGDDVFFAASADGGETFGPAARVTVEGGGASHPSLVSGREGLVHVAWTQEDGEGGRDTRAARGCPSEAAAVPPLADAGSGIRVAPNPARTAVHLRWPAPAGAGTEGPAAIAIHDVTGRLVRTLRAAAGRRGEALAEWDGKDAAGRAAPPGVYFASVRLDRGDGPAREVARFVLVR